MKKIKELISFCYGNDVVRYVFFGGCTTLVNLVCFYILWNLCHLNLNIANVISIIVAIIFAYIVNSKYVFQDKCETLRDHIRPFCKFISARLLTMVIVNAQLVDAKKELFNLRFQNATNQLDNTSRIKEVRKNIARIQTIITEKAKVAE